MSTELCEYENHEGFVVLSIVCYLIEKLLQNLHCLGGKCL